MNVDLGAAIAVGSIIFAAGGAWITISTTSKRGALQGKRIGKLEIQVAELRGLMRTRRGTQPLGIPIPPSTDED